MYALHLVQTKDKATHNKLYMCYGKEVIKKKLTILNNLFYFELKHSGIISNYKI